MKRTKTLKSNIAKSPIGHQLNYT